MGLKTIYNLIKKDIRQHPKVEHSVLNRVTEWKRSHYTILSEIISEELGKSEALKGEKIFEIGNTISHITLQRFFENDYQDKTHNDLRFLKTLEKICIFLGFENLNDYIAHKKPPPEQTTKHPDDYSDFSPDLIYNYCLAEFKCFQEFSKKSCAHLLDFVFKDSPLHERVSMHLEAQSKLNLHLVTDNNRSNFEIFDFEYISDEKDKKVLKTQEFWNLLFRRDTGEEHIINRLNTQIYFIKKIDGIWKIWDNYNPNAGELLKPKKTT